MINPSFLKQLNSHLTPNQVFTEPSDCWVYGYDNSRQHVLPDYVVFAQSQQDVQFIVKTCYDYDIPVVARGLGSGTPGGSVPLHHGLVLSLERMKNILIIDDKNRLMIVEPGVTNTQVQKKAAEVGFFWPPDPTSADFCTIGGNLAYNSAGPRAIKYGTPRENTLGLTCVTGTGELLKTGVHTTKGVVGYDLTRLIIGSEGTLAIITEAILKLTPLPEKRYTLRALYHDIHSAASAVSRIMAQPITPYALEFMDEQAINIVRHYSELTIPREAKAMLMIEIDGVGDLEYSVEKIKLAANLNGCIEIITAKNAEETNQLWQMRKALSPSLRKIAPNKINEDVVVPVAQIPELINGLAKISAQYDIPIVNFGHAGNGNIHVNLLYDPNNQIQQNHVDACLEAVFDLVLQLNGTLSGEHGIGLVKKGFVPKELSPYTLQLMKEIKQIFDPKNILNPGKIF